MDFHKPSVHALGVRLDKKLSILYERSVFDYMFRLRYI